MFMRRSYEACSHIHVFIFLFTYTNIFKFVPNFPNTIMIAKSGNNANEISEGFL